MPAFAQAPDRKPNAATSTEPSYRVDNFDLPGVEPADVDSGVYRFSELPPEPEARAKKSPPFRGYTKQKRLFQNLCERVYEDGRAVYLSKIGEEYKGGTIGCSACKSFFRLLFSQCKKVPADYKSLEKDIANAKRTLALKKKTKDKALKNDEEQEAAAIEIEIKDRAEKLVQLEYTLPRLQMEPRLSVIDAVSRLSQALVDDKKRIDSHFQAIKILESSLLEPNEKTSGQKSYFEILAEYLMAPFFHYEDKIERIKRVEEQKAEQRKREFMFDTQKGF